MPSTNIRIVSHNNGASAKALAAALGNPQLLKKMQPSPLPRFVRDAYVINFGVHPEDTNVRVHSNQPQYVDLASDKLRAFQSMQREGVSVVPFSGAGIEVLNLCPVYTLDGRETRTVVARTLTRASEGRGIELIDFDPVGLSRTPMVQAPLYTAYIPKHAEYRVHVGVQGSNVGVIDITKKARRTDVPDDQVNWRIRNYDNGFTFAREGLDLAEPTVQRVIEQAKLSVRALGLTFGAVDVVVQSNRERSVYVLEVNTAPGMEGTTLERYVEFFQACANNTAWTGLTVPASTNVPHANREVVAPQPAPQVRSETRDASVITSDVASMLPRPTFAVSATPQYCRELADFLSQKAEELYALAG